MSLGAIVPRTFLSHLGSLTLLENSPSRGFKEAPSVLIATVKKGGWTEREEQRQSERIDESNAFVQGWGRWPPKGPGTVTIW